MLLPTDAHAQGRRTPPHGGGGGGGGGRVVSGGGVRGGGPVVVSRGGYARPYYYRSFYRPYFYDPFFWGSYGWGWGWGVGAGYSYGWGWGPYGYGYPYGGGYGYGYPYGYGGYRGYSEARIEVHPKEAKVYIDGYYAGIVDDFDGWAQRLDVPPGEHEIEIYQEGYHTKREQVLFRPGKTVNIKGELEKLGPGQPPEPAPQPVQPPPGQNQVQQQRRQPPPYGAGTPYGPGPDPNGGTVQADQPPPPPSSGGTPYGRPSRRAPQYQARATDPSEFGTLSIRVQPRDAEISVDGERWETPQSQTGFSIQMAPGRHRVEVKKDGFRAFTAEVQIESGELTPLNVSLLAARENEN
jgi:hypothetical protein